MTTATSHDAFSVFDEEHMFYLPFAIVVLHSVLTENNAKLPVRVDINKISEIANTSLDGSSVISDLRSYFRSLIEPRPGV